MVGAKFKYPGGLQKIIKPGVNTMPGSPLPKPNNIVKPGKLQIKRSKLKTPVISSPPPSSVNISHNRKLVSGNALQTASVVAGSYFKLNQYTFDN
jgi:hypothetical protein